jgi:hypothetical protein
VAIDGVASVLLGAPIVTRDLDLCFNPAPENVEKLSAAVQPFHPWLRVKGLSDQEAGQLAFSLDACSLRQAQILTLQTDVDGFDLMAAVPGVGEYTNVLAAAIDTDTGVGFLKVLDLPRLIASKRVAGRPKDLLAMPQLEATLRLREAQQRTD